MRPNPQEKTKWQIVGYPIFKLKINNTALYFPSPQISLQTGREPISDPEMSFISPTYLEAAFFQNGILTTFWPCNKNFLFSVQSCPNLDKIGLKTKKNYKAKK